ncbi:MAG: hypothetical protein LQ351_007358 [Letrouitia transgressa]|nr:MAG: hypothetical protein LQ351_007358 [Letrouitia transgressa]
MAATDRIPEQEHINLQLNPEERRYFGQLFSSADNDKIGVVTGEVAVKFFEKTRLPPSTLGEIWQIADTENRGLLTPTGFGQVLRLIGYAQAGRQVTPELALKPGGPLPKFDGIPGPAGPPPNQAPAPIQPQTSGPIRVPPLLPDKVAQYSSLFEGSGVQDGLLSGETAKQIFERAQLPNEVLGRIWNLADTEQRGLLSLTEFIIAMHLLASYKSGAMRALPQILPAGLYEAASRRGIPRQGTGSRPTPDAIAPASTIPRQFSGTSYQRPGSPAARPPLPLSQRPETPTGGLWAVSPQDKAQFNQIFATVDTANRGFITGDQAVSFFSNSRLPEEALAQIWDLADIRSEGQLNRDEFAVAMYLIRQQRSKRDGREVLPQTLPQNLIPPSMRQQPVPPPQPTAPTFDNAANVTAPKSAADDLFGLDAISSSPKAPESTGDSSLYTASPPRTAASPQATQSPQQPTVFKPFVPSSSFGQSLTLPNNLQTNNASPGHSREPQQERQHSAMDDLLGDNDPEVSQKLTQETTELANLSNQVSTLSGQMQDVRPKKVSTEQDMSQLQNQKRDFETRLAFLRSAYENEVRELKALEESNTTIRNEVRKLQSDIAMIEGAREDLASHHRQAVESHNGLQRERDELKERLRQANIVVSGLKPQVEKIESDIRQQKGLVAINKKQLATIEAERDKQKARLDEAIQEHEMTLNEAAESKNALETKQEVRSSPNVASPPPAATSMNPFFRRQSTEPTGKTVASPLAQTNIASPSAFDNFFGPSFGSQTSTPPPTSFQSDQAETTREITQQQVKSEKSGGSSDGQDFPTPSGSPPPLALNDTPQGIVEPPAPPKSRQITSSLLPFGKNLERSGSESSSIRANPPASRIGSSGFDTPVGPNPSSESTFRPLVVRSPNQDTSEVQQISPVVGESASPTSTSHEDGFGPGTVSQDMPGGFPGDITPPPSTTKMSQPGAVREPSNLHLETSAKDVIDPFMPSGDRARSAESAKEDFNSAFKDFGNQTQSNGDKSMDDFDQAGASKNKGEFPPIQELEGDDDSESSSDHGFEDNFTAASSPHTQAAAQSGPSLQTVAPVFGDIEENTLTPTRPPITTTDSNNSQLPTPGAQKSPPTYDQTMSSPESSLQPGLRRESNQFPQEYTGLLPSRDNPTSPASGQSSDSLAINQTDRSEPPTPAAHAPMAPGSSEAPFSYQRAPSQGSHSQAPTVPAKTAFDDFDSEFADLSEAREADEKGDEEFPSHKGEGYEEFNPTFDSPTSTRAANFQYGSNSSFTAQNSFRDFEPNISSRAPTSQSGNPTAASISHDWDAIFAGLGTPQKNGMESDPTSKQVNSSQALPGARAEAQAKPPLARGLSLGTEHDDPILKRLTGMGFSRDASLAALEKYDYNIDKAADFLTSK